MKAQDIMNSRANAVNAAGKIVGMVSEGDLLRRLELGTDHKPSRWLHFFPGSSTPAEFIKIHGATAAEIICKSVVSVTPDEDLQAVVTTMESKGVKRVLVVEDGVPVGIIARADLLPALSRAGVTPQPESGSDWDVRADI